MTVKLCIFGGSFDPVHEGHVCVAEHARKYCGMDRVLFMPCSLSPLKEQAPSVTDDQRCRMIELALQGIWSFRLLRGRGGWLRGRRSVIPVQNCSG